MDEIASGPGLGAQLATIARRSVRRTVRQRRLLILPLVVPMILFAINASSLASASEIHGLPPVSYTAFALGVPFLLGAMLGAVSVGTDLAHDIETGFLTRLALTPMRRTAILLGQLAGALVMALGQSLLFLLVGVLSGVTIASGIAGAIVLLTLSVLIAFTFAAIGTLLAVRTGRGAAVQGFFPCRRPTGAASDRRDTNHGHDPRRRQMPNRAQHRILRARRAGGLRDVGPRHRPHLGHHRRFHIITVRWWPPVSVA